MNIKVANIKINTVQFYGFILNKMLAQAFWSNIWIELDNNNTLHTMKNYTIKLIALLIFASVAISSCSVEYQQRHHHDDHGYNNDHHDNYNH